MKNYLSTPLITLAVLLTVSCSNESALDETEASLLTEESLLKEQELTSRVSEPDEKLRVVPNIYAGKTYYIKNHGSEKWLDVFGASTENGANVHQWSFTGGANQKWKIERNSNGTAKITSVGSNKSLDINGGSLDHGANVIQWAYTNSKHQQFQIPSGKDEDRRYFIRAEHSGKNLGVKGNHDERGSNVQQEKKSKSNDRLWEFYEVEQVQVEVTN